MVTRPPDRHQGLAVTVALYGVARLALVAAVAGLLILAGTPLLVAVLVGLIVALPLSMVLFRGMRARLDTALAQSRERRTQERDALRRGLRGEEPRDPATGSEEPVAHPSAERQPDRGEDRPGEQ